MTIRIIDRLGCVCFGVKPFQEMILHLTVCLVAHGKYNFSEKHFIWSCVLWLWHKNWFTFLFSFQTIFGSQTCKERERERERKDHRAHSLTPILSLTVVRAPPTVWRAPNANPRWVSFSSWFISQSNYTSPPIHTPPIHIPSNPSSQNPPSNL